MNALAFVIDGLYYGVSDFGYAAYSMVMVFFLSISFVPPVTHTYKYIHTYILNRLKNLFLLLWTASDRCHICGFLDFGYTFLGSCWGMGRLVSLHDFESYSRFLEVKNSSVFHSNHFHHKGTRNSCFNHNKFGCTEWARELDHGNCYGLTMWMEKKIPEPYPTRKL